MSVQTVVDASDLLRLERQLARVPDQIRRVAARRALRRVEQMLKTRIVKRSSERIKAPVRKIGERVRMVALSSDLEARVRSDWLRLIDLKPSQNKAGVRVPIRGSYRSAFIATMRSKAVFKREGKARGPVNELFGPNPASDVINSPDIYLDLLVDVMETHLLPRFMHEIDRAFPR